MSALSRYVIRLIVLDIVFRIGRSMALFHRHRQADRDVADCQTSLLTGTGEEQRCANDWSLSRYGRHALFFGRS